MSDTRNDTEKMPAFEERHLNALKKGLQKIRESDAPELQASKKQNNQDLLDALKYLEKNPTVTGIVNFEGVVANARTKTLRGELVKVTPDLISNAILVLSTKDPERQLQLKDGDLTNVMVFLDALAREVSMRERKVIEGQIRQQEGINASSEAEKLEESRVLTEGSEFLRVSPPTQKTNVSSAEQKKVSTFKVENLVIPNKRSNIRKKISDDIDKIISLETISENDKLARVIDTLEEKLSKTKVSKKEKILEVALNDYKIKYNISDEQLEMSRLNKENINGIINKIDNKMKEGTFTYDDYSTLQSLMLAKKSRKIIKNSLNLEYKECNSNTIEFIAGSLIQKSLSLYTNLDRRDFLEKAFDENKELSFEKLVQHFSDTQRVILNSLLEGDVDQRTITLEHWIRVAHHCLHNDPSDVFTTHMILSALDSTEVMRLTITEQGLSDEARKMRSEIRDLFNPDGNMKAYEKYLEDHPNAIPTPQKISKDFILFDASKPEGVLRQNYDVMYDHLNKVSGLLDRLANFQPEKKFNPDGLLDANLRKMSSISFEHKGLQYSSVFISQDFNAPGHAKMREEIKQSKDDMLGTQPYLRSNDQELEEARIKKSKDAISNYFDKKSKAIGETGDNVQVKKSKRNPALFYRNKIGKSLFSFSLKNVADQNSNEMESLAIGVLTKQLSPQQFKFNISDKRKNVGFGEYAIWIYENKKPIVGELDPMRQSSKMKALAAIWLMLNNPGYFNPNEATESAINNAINKVDLTKVFLKDLNEADKLKLISLLKQPISDISNNSMLPSELKLVLLTIMDPKNSSQEKLKQDKTLESRLVEARQTSSRAETQAEVRLPPQAEISTSQVSISAPVAKVLPSLSKKIPSTEITSITYSAPHLHDGLYLLKERMEGNNTVYMLMRNNESMGIRHNRSGVLLHMENDKIQYSDNPEKNPFITFDSFQDFKQYLMNEKGYQESDFLNIKLSARPQAKPLPVPKPKAPSPLESKSVEPQGVPQQARTTVQMSRQPAPQKLNLQQRSVAETKNPIADKPNGQAASITPNTNQPLAIPSASHPTVNQAPHLVEWERFNHCIDAAIKACHALQEHSSDMDVFLEATTKMLELGKIKKKLPDDQKILSDDKNTTDAMTLFHEVLELKAKEEKKYYMVIDAAIRDCKILVANSGNDVSEKAKVKQAQLEELRSKPIEAISKDKVIGLAKDVVELKKLALERKQEDTGGHFQPKE